MKIGLLAIVALFGALVQAPVYGQESTFESEESLFILAPHPSGAKGAIALMWIPRPIEKYCLGQTAERCAAIDFCIRTTSKEVSMCRSLPASLRHLPAYPPDMRPRRVLSTVLVSIQSMKGYGALRKYFDEAPAGSLDHISMDARVRARVKLTRTPQDDGFQLLEVLDVPSR